jgi:hypothetical protein
LKEQTEEHTDRGTYRQRNIQTEEHTDRGTYRKRNIQRNIQTEEHTDRGTYRKRNIQTEEHTDRGTYRGTYRQRNIQTEEHTDNFAKSCSANQEKPKVRDHVYNRPQNVRVLSQLTVLTYSPYYLKIVFT